MFRSNLLWIVYVIVGVVVAADQGYFQDVDKLIEVLEAALAVLLWPLLLFDVDINLDDSNGGESGQAPGGSGGK
jgi:hypothetical protein